MANPNVPKPYDGVLGGKSTNPARVPFQKDFQIKYIHNDCETKEVLTFNNKYILHIIDFTTYPQSEYRTYYLYNQFVGFQIHIMPNNKKAELEFQFSSPKNPWFNFGLNGLEINYAKEIETFIVENIIPNL